MNNKIIGSFTFSIEDDLLVHQLEVLTALCDEVVIQGDAPTKKAHEIALAYTDNTTVFYFENKKQDRFNQRDEFGDRQRLLDFAKSRNADVHLHTDTDEFFAVKDIFKVKEILNNCREDEIYSFRRYDFWGNAFNYRTSYHTTQHANKQIENYKANVVYSYIYHLKHSLNFAQHPTPNFHSPRIPSFNVQMNTILNEDVNIYHLGYYLDSLIEEKGNFYKQNLHVTQNCWGEDMQVNRDTFLEKWGMGIINRKI